MMKKVISLLMVFAMALAMVACGSTTTDTGGDGKNR